MQLTLVALLLLVLAGANAYAMVNAKTKLGDSIPQPLQVATYVNIGVAALSVAGIVFLLTHHTGASPAAAPQPQYYPDQAFGG